MVIISILRISGVTPRGSKRFILLRFFIFGIIYVLMLFFGFTNEESFSRSIFYIQNFFVAAGLYLVILHFIFKITSKQPKKEKKKVVKIEVPEEQNDDESVSVEEIIKSMNWYSLKKISDEPLICEGQLTEDLDRGIIKKIRITSIHDNLTKFQAKLSVELPYVIVLRELDPNKLSYHQEARFPLLENAYYVDIFSPKLYSLLKESHTFLLNKLMAFNPYISYFALSKSSLEVIVKDNRIIPQLHSFIIELYEFLKGSVAHFEPSYEVHCYNCGDRFDEFEERCDTCGAPRPKCPVCLADLKIEEKQDIVKLPCCGAYAHRDHIIKWLETEQTCPLCHKSLIKWLNSLKT